MKNLITVLVLLVLSFALPAQDLDYFSFEPEWRVNEISGGYHCYPHIQLSYFLDGDTVMTNGLAYKKVYKKVLTDYVEWMEPTPCSENTFSVQYGTSIRQDGNAMFEWDGFQDTLLYDFNLSIGDTLQSSVLFQANLSSPVIVQEVDSIETNMGWHKRFWINYNNSEIEYIIEGIGHDRGFLHPMGQPLNYYSQLVCYGQQGEPIVETGQDCEFALSTTEYSFGVLEVFPNPSDGVVRIEIPNGLNKSDVEFVVLDARGQTIIRNIGAGRNFEMLNTGDWTKGVYQIILTLDGNSYANQLIVN